MRFQTVFLYVLLSILLFTPIYLMTKDGRLSSKDQVQERSIQSTLVKHENKHFFVSPSPNRPASGAVR